MDWLIVLWIGVMAFYGLSIILLIVHHRLWVKAFDSLEQSDDWRRFYDDTRAGSTFGFYGLKAWRPLFRVEEYRRPRTIGFFGDL